MVFSLYTVPEDGAPMWTEDYGAVDVVDGTFNVELGSVTSFPLDISRETALFLGVAVNGAIEMSPRLKVSSALRARWAAHAKDVRGEDIHPNSVRIRDQGLGHLHFVCAGIAGRISSFTSLVSGNRITIMVNASATRIDGCTTGR